MFAIDLKGKVALVTGGARGLGREFTIALAQAGATVVYTSRNSESIKEIDKYLVSNGLVGMGVEIDATSQNALIQLENFLSDRNISIDILVNNVGHTLEVNDYNVDIESWKSVLNLNFFTHVNFSNFFIEKMKLKKWGRIINITSIAGLEVSGPAPFNCSKAALTAYTRSVGRLLAIQNPEIVMTAIAPGIVATTDGHWERMKVSNPQHVKDYFQHRAAIKRFGTESEISGILVFLASEHASFFHGSIIQVDGGQSRSYFAHTYL